MSSVHKGVDTGVVAAGVLAAGVLAVDDDEAGSLDDGAVTDTLVGVVRAPDPLDLALLHPTTVTSASAISALLRIIELPCAAPARSSFKRRGVHCQIPPESA